MVDITGVHPHLEITTSEFKRPKPKKVLDAENHCPLYIIRSKKGIHNYPVFSNEESNLFATFGKDTFINPDSPYFTHQSIIAAESTSIPAFYIRALTSEEMNLSHANSMICVSFDSNINVIRIGAFKTNYSSIEMAINDIFGSSLSSRTLDEDFTQDVAKRPRIWHPILFFRGLSKGSYYSQFGYRFSSSGEIAKGDSFNRPEYNFSFFFKEQGKANVTTIKNKLSENQIGGVLDSYNGIDSTIDLRITKLIEKYYVQGASASDGDSLEFSIETPMNPNVFRRLKYEIQTTSPSYTKDTTQPEDLEYDIDSLDIFSGSVYNKVTKSRFLPESPIDVYTCSDIITPILSFPKEYSVIPDANWILATVYKQNDETSVSKDKWVYGDFDNGVYLQSISITNTDQNSTAPVSQPKVSLTNDELSQLVIDTLNNEDVVRVLADKALVPCTHVYNTGYSSNVFEKLLELRDEMIYTTTPRTWDEIQSLPKNIPTELTGPIIRNEINRASSMKASLSTSIGERAGIFGQVGYFLDLRSGYVGWFPTLIKVFQLRKAYHSTAKITGDFGPLDNNVLDVGKVDYTLALPDARELAFTSGLNLVVNTDMNTKIFPIFRSVYGEETSAFADIEVCDWLCYAKKNLNRTYNSLVGTRKPSKELLSTFKDVASTNLIKAFEGKANFEIKPYLTVADAQNNWSIHCDVYMFVSSAFRSARVNIILFNSADSIYAETLDYVDK